MFYLNELLIWTSNSIKRPASSMLTLSTQFMVALGFILLLLTILQATNHQSAVSRRKSAPFECGFSPHDTARLPFSLRFFLLAIIFLIFDIEIVLLFPLVWCIKSILSITTYLGGGLFIIILIVGLIHEWGQGSLTWVYYDWKTLNL